MPFSFVSSLMQRTFSAFTPCSCRELPKTMTSTMIGNLCPQM